MTKLGLDFLQASLDESKAASLSSASTSFSLLKATVSRAKVGIQSRENKIVELQSHLHSKKIMTKTVPPPEEVGKN